MTTVYQAVFASFVGKRNLYLQVPGLTVKFGGFYFFTVKIILYGNRNGKIVLCILFVFFFGAVFDPYRIHDLVDTSVGIGKYIYNLVVKFCFFKSIQCFFRSFGKGSLFGLFRTFVNFVRGFRIVYGSGA